MTTLPDSAPDGGNSRTLVVLLLGRHASVERLLGAARRQGCTLTNLVLGPGEHAGVTRVSLTIDGGHPERLAQQIARLVDVVDVRDTTHMHATRDASPSDEVSTPFHTQADGALPVESDLESPHTPMED